MPVVRAYARMPAQFSVGQFVRCIKLL